MKYQKYKRLFLGEREITFYLMRIEYNLYKIKVVQNIYLIVTFLIVVKESKVIKIKRKRVENILLR